MKEGKGGKVWKGRFRTPLHPEALQFSSCLCVDRRLYKEDIEGSIAHVSMLAKQEILTRKEADKIVRALEQIEKEIESRKFKLDSPATSSDRFVAEDVHMAIEARLFKKIGPLAGKLHTARSRNDQVALDERLYLKRTSTEIMESIRSLQRAFVTVAEKFQDVLMPGYTHMQRAQPVLLAHHLLAYVYMLDRDHDRFRDCLKRIDASPLGAAALAGTSFPIDRKRTARMLGLSNIVYNSMDAVSDRDVQIEFLSACSIAQMHLSRLAEELLLWSSQEWRFAEIAEEFTTGSSIMPQKRNPDIAELVRGKTGRVYGSLMGMLTMMKGLPLAYNRDLQEDKSFLFDAADTTTDSLRMCTLMMESIHFQSERFTKELRSDFLLATELADFLVRKGLPFRTAHACVGEAVALASDRRCSLSDLTLPEYRKISKLFDESLYKLLDPRTSIELKRSVGSTSPAEVKADIRGWRKRLW